MTKKLIRIIYYSYQDSPDFCRSPNSLQKTKLKNHFLFDFYIVCLSSIKSNSIKLLIHIYFNEYFKNVKEKVLNSKKGSVAKSEIQK